MKRLFLPLLLALAAIPAAAEEIPELTAQQIQEAVRYSHSLQQADLVGQIKADNGAKATFDLKISGQRVRFRFRDPEQSIVLDNLHGGYKLTESTLGSPTTTVPTSKYGEPIRGTDMLYEDLAMRFLYWPQSNLRGVESIKGRDAWKLHIVNPNRAPRVGPYSQVYIWVDQKSGGLMKMEAFDWGGKRVKRYEVKSAQKIKGTWMLKKMEVETYKDGKRVGSTSLRLREP